MLAGEKKFQKGPQSTRKRFKECKRLRGGVEVQKRPGKIGIEIKTINGQKSSPLGSISRGGIDNKILSETLLVAPIQ